MESRLLVATGIAWLYVCLRFVHYLPGGIAARIGAAVVLLLIAEYQQITARFFGTIASPELPRALLVAVGWAFGSLVLLTMLLLLRDVFSLLVFAFARRTGSNLLRSGGLSLGIGALAGVLGFIGVWQATRVPAIKTVPVSMPGLPAAFDGYRIVQLSDIHSSRLLPGSWLAKVVDKANGLNPDLIVITGDLADGSPAARQQDVQALARLQARDGVLAIPGNHEYYSDYEAWMARFENMGLPMLLNRHVLIRRDGTAIAVAGITDPQATAFGEPRPDLRAALAGIPATARVILLAHRPAQAHTSAAAGVALQLSGHTHGGQIPGLAWLAKRGNGGFVSGLYRVGAMALYVSSGTGLWNGLVLRLGHPSEITLLVLHQQRQ